MGTMAFMMKKKKYKFTVELCLEELTAVPFVSAVLFVKVRLLDGGNFSEISSREEVKDHTVRWGAKFEFVCKMSANASTGILDPCILRVSVRKELKGGRSYQKLGFTDLNLAEFAGSGLMTRRCLLEGYDTRHRQDNSMLRLNIRMNMLSGDVLFKVPSPSQKQKQLSEGDTADRIRGEEFSSGSSGFGSLPKKRPPLFSSELLTSASGAVNTEPSGQDTVSELEPPMEQEENNHSSEPGHSRNSSNTSQLSRVSGYSSQHSRQSSSGTDSAAAGHTRNASSGSGGLSETGSLDRGKAALERRKKATEETSTGGRVEGTRVNPDSLIDELIKSSNLDKPDDTTSSTGLQLFIAKDGTTALGGHDVASQMPIGVFKQVVMEENR